MTDDLGQKIRTEHGGVVEYRTHYPWAVILFTILTLVLVHRFFLLQILRGEEYEKRARIDRIIRSRIPARRGEIRDRSARVLAHNVSEHSIAVVPARLEQAPETLPRLRELLGLTVEEYGDIARRVQRAVSRGREQRLLTVMYDVVSDRCPFDGAALALGGSEPVLWCPACGGRFETLAPDQRRCRRHRKDLELGHDGRVGRCPACGTTYVREQRCPEDGAPLQQRLAALACPECGRSFDDQLAIVNTHLHELPGLSVHTAIRRRYPERFRLGHILGYTNEVNAQDMERFPGVYERGEYIGRAGAERGLEGDPTRPFLPNLRGTPGEEVFFRDSLGTRRRPREVTRSLANLESTPAVPGDDVWLTIDLGVQRIVERAMRYHPSGAVVVIEVHTGRILAIYSKPGFDPNVWSGRLTPEAKREYDENPYSPMMNKALTAYAPGSIYKVVTALAALNEGVIDETTTFHCPGYYEFGGRRFGCHKKSGHGDMDLVQAIKHSCDVYFYRAGEELGMDRLERYAREMFGFGAPTGIEVAERVGRVPSKDWHRRHSRIGWQPGFTLSTAVGQGALLASPLQLARVYGALANGGRLSKARLVLQVTRPDGSVRRRYMPETERRLGVAPEHLALVQRGLVTAVGDEDGTGREAHIDAIPIAGKTGTAEAKQVKRGVPEDIARWLLQDHAWFAAYAPATDPQIALVVFLEHGGSGGKNAAPVARKIIQEYFREEYGRVPEPPRPPASPSEPGAPTQELDGIR